MTNSDRLAVLWLDLDGKLFNLGLTLAVIGAIKREPFYFLLMALKFLRRQVLGPCADDGRRQAFHWGWSWDTAEMIKDGK